MGMYDEVILPFMCPNCGYEEEKHRWQTKVFDNIMWTYKEGATYKTDSIEMKEGRFNVHAICVKCDKLIDAGATVKNYRITSRVDYSPFKNELKGRGWRISKKRVKELAAILKKMKASNQKAIRS